MQDDHQSEGQITDQDNLFGLDVVSMRPVLGKGALILDTL